MANERPPAAPEAKPGLTPVSAQPENLESPIQVMKDWITPNELFYVRNHLPYPEIDLASWRLTVDGEVERPLSLAYDDLARLPQVSRIVTLECAGNKRGTLSLPAPGPQWNIGAVGNARWTGVPLSALLAACGPRATGLEAVFTGADRGGRADMAGEFNYVRSLSLGEGVLNDCLLALAMNDEPLPLKHGFPLRLIVPGWYGMAHVKWLNRISIAAQPFSGPWQTVDYMYVTDESDLTTATPVREIKVNSIITWPFREQTVKQGKQVIRGLAWTGAGTIAAVRVSSDGGFSWRDARLTSPEHGPYTWTFWECDWPADRPGHYQIMAKAEDSEGNRQPAQPVWNAKGYGNNGIHSLHVTVPAMG